jgi:hypothetical protein
VKERERAAAIRYLIRHPAHGDRKAAAAVSFQLTHGRLPRRGELRAFLHNPSSRWLVTDRAVTYWRQALGLAPAAPSARGYRPPRLRAVRVACGHGLGVPAPVPDEDEPLAWCWRCHAWQALASRPEREQLATQAALDRLRRDSVRSQPPDTMPPDPTPPHFVDRELGDALADLRERLVHGKPRGKRERLVAAFRSGGRITTTEAEALADEVLHGEKKRATGKARR